MSGKYLAALAVILCVTACNVDHGGTLAVPVKGTASQAAPGPISATPVPLPFDNPFPNRWNDANNGSPYEPCIAFADSELVRFGIVPSTIEDAAIVDGQGVRGCNWTMKNNFSISHLVTNSRSLDVYRAGTSENIWKPSFEVGGRPVGVFALNFGQSRECSTYVQSFSAAVVTNVVTSTSDEGQKIDACKLVEDFTRAYIDKIPG